eukprot:144544-Amorphochlora_amoeboformis.AAC.2
MSTLEPIKEDEGNDDKVSEALAKVDKKGGGQSEKRAEFRKPTLLVDTKVSSRRGRSRTKERKIGGSRSPRGRPYTPEEGAAASKIQQFYRRRRSIVKQVLSPNSVKLKTQMRRQECAPVKRRTHHHPGQTQSMSALGALEA